jgi:uncharacterized membrane protein YgcG
VPPAASRLVADLTAKDPARRPASAAAAAEQAIRVRDSITGGAPSRLAATAAPPFRPDLGNARSGTLVDAHQLTWHNAPVGRPGRGPRRGRALLLALGAALVGGLATWLVTIAIPAASHGLPRSPASSPAIQTVDVNRADLVGQQASDVSQTLCSLGLTPVMTFTSSSQADQLIQNGEDPGTVISVSPTGQVPVGSPVTLTVVRERHHDLGNIGDTGGCGSTGAGGGGGTGTGGGGGTGTGGGGAN